MPVEIRFIIEEVSVADRREEPRQGLLRRLPVVVELAPEAQSRRFAAKHLSGDPVTHSGLPALALDQPAGLQILIVVG